MSAAKFFHVQPLPRSFYDRNALRVAPALIGCLIVRRLGPAVLFARIVETEAYLGPHDLACHARAGRTPRTEVMYGEPGHAYVYLVYGLHCLLNAVCGPGDDANAVLLRAAEPIAQRGPLLHSATGPGNLTTALDIGLRHNRHDLCDPRGELFIAPRQGKAPRICRSARVGIDYAGPRWAKENLRFCDRDSRLVSRPVPFTPRRAR